MSGIAEQIRKAALGPRPTKTQLCSFDAWMPGHSHDRALYHLSDDGWHIAPRDIGWLFCEPYFVFSDETRQRVFLLLVAEAIEP